MEDSPPSEWFYVVDAALSLAVACLAIAAICWCIIEWRSDRD